MSGLLSTASSLALAGMQAAEKRVAIRAHNISNLGTPGFQGVGVEQTATASGPVVSARPPEPAAAPVDPGLSLFAQLNPVEEIVDLTFAQNAFEAAAKTFKIADELQRSTLDLKS